MELTAAAKEHFAPQVTLTKADYDFQRRYQEEDETTDEFLTSLRILAEDCRFGDQLDRNLMLQPTARRRQDLLSGSSSKISWLLHTSLLPKS